MKYKVSLAEKSHKHYRYRVTWTQGGKRKSKWFERKGKAQKFQSDKIGELTSLGNAQAPITDEELRAIHSFREAKDALSDHMKDITLSFVVKIFVDRVETRHQSISCQEVSDKLIAKLLAESKSKSHRDSLEYRLKKFNAEYGDWKTCDVNTSVIDDFLSNLNVGLQTQLHYRRAVGQMFNHAVLLKATRVNPVNDAIRPKAAPTETGILTPLEVASLLQASDDSTLPGLAISFFAGVRRAELERLDWSEINFDEGFIEIKAKNAKTAQRRLISMSENLTAWIKPHRKTEGKVIKSPAIWRKGQEKAREDAKLENWPHNAGRHSFASYHLAMHEDSGKLAMDLGHPDPRLLFAHYRKLVTKKTAQLYWRVTPAVAKKMVKAIEASHKRPSVIHVEKP